MLIAYGESMASAKLSKRNLIFYGTVFLVFLGVLAYSVLIEPATLVVQKQTIDLPHWSPGLNNLKVVVLSDLHIGSLHNTVERLRSIVMVVN